MSQVPNFHCMLKDLPTPITLVQKAKGTPEARLEVANRYQFLIEEFLFLKCQERQWGPMEEEAKREWVAEQFREKILPVIYENLSKGADYKQKPFRARLYDWIVEVLAANVHTFPNFVGIPNDEDWSNLCQQRPLAKARERLRYNHPLLFKAWSLREQHTDEKKMPNKTLAAELDIQEAAFRQRLHRAREQHDHYLLCEIRELLGDPSLQQEWEEIIRLNHPEDSWSSMLEMHFEPLHLE